MTTVFMASSPENNTDDFIENNLLSNGNIKTQLLLVEDDKVNQMLGKKMLIKAGYEVEVADDGLQAIELLNKKHFDLIITDIKTPNMGGYELTSYIRASKNSSYSNIPVIAVSAYPSAIEKEKAINAGLNDYVSKPFIIAELITIINSHINK